MTLSQGKYPEADCNSNDFVPRIYSGVANDLRIMKRPPEGEMLFLITDLPFSLVVDTLALPYTICMQLAWGNICPTPPTDFEEVPAEP